jgi:hypothetical protein
LAWSFPLVFLVHDAEEVLTAEVWARRHARLVDRAPAVLAPLVRVTTGQMAVAVAFLFGGVCAVAALAARATGAGPRVTIFATALAALFINGLTHVAQALALRGYVPGLVTAVVLVLPYTAAALRRLLVSRLVTGRQLAGAHAAAGLLTVPVVLGALALGRALTRR